MLRLLPVDEKWPQRKQEPNNMQAPHPAFTKTTLAHFETAPPKSVDDSIQSK